MPKEDSETVAIAGIIIALIGVLGGNIYSGSYFNQEYYKYCRDQLDQPIPKGGTSIGNYIVACFMGVIAWYIAGIIIQLLLITYMSTNRYI